LKPEWWGSHWLKRRSTRGERKPVTRDNNINTSSNICHSLKSKKEKKNSDNV
jgi:hypothetical protein